MLYAISGWISSIAMRGSFQPAIRAGEMAAE
jgi:hypothetical protein